MYFLFVWPPASSWTTPIASVCCCIITTCELFRHWSRSMGYCLPGVWCGTLPANAGQPESPVSSSASLWLWMGVSHTCGPAWNVCRTVSLFFLGHHLSPWSCFSSLFLFACHRCPFSPVLSRSLPIAWSSFTLTFPSSHHVSPSFDCCPPPPCPPLWKEECLREMLC